MALKPNKMLAAVLGAALLLGVLAAFAIELGNTQAHNQADVRTRVHQRAALAGALIDGLFSTVSQQRAQDMRLYGHAKVRRRVLDRNRAANTFLVVIGARGRLLGRSTGITPAVARQLVGDVSVAQARSTGLYGLGNVIPYRGGRVITLAVPFPTSHGERLLISGFAPALLAAFLQSDLKKIPGVTGARNYVVDGNGAILASTGPAVAPGTRFTGPLPSGSAPRLSRDTGSHYYDEVRLAGSDWRIVLDSPDGALYAPVSGLNKWLPWVLFGAFAIVGFVAFLLVAQILRAADETRHANAQLDTLNQELEGSNQMLAQRAAELARSNEELDQFASIASHDLQEPLRKVRTFTQELVRMEEDHLTEKGRDYLWRANAAAERMQTLIQDLLKFSRVSTHAEGFTDVDLQQVVQEVLDDLSESIESSGADVHVGELPTVHAEPLQMRQLFQNLISNALKFHAPDVAPEVWIEGSTDDEEARLIVRDNGIGFDSRYAARIFRVFERLHGRGEFPGTGIGLAVCRKIVDRHGGAIAAESVPGHGATFTVMLPVRRPSTRPSAPTASPAATAPRGPESGSDQPDPAPAGTDSGHAQAHV